VADDGPDATLARRLIAAQFPRWADLPITPVEPSGVDNRTFRLGDSLSIRLPSADEYAHQVEKEHRWLPALAPALPLPIPEPVAKGAPQDGYPYSWSVYRWIDGEIGTEQTIRDLSEFAGALGDFLVALRGIDGAGGPRPGPHNFHRGGPLTEYADETVEAIAALRGEVPEPEVIRAWDDALAASWDRAPVWFHGDVAVGNLLVQDGRLSAVIDFGLCGVGDPACDLAIAWTLFSGRSRDAFRAAVDCDAPTWSRGRGWALWKALISLEDHLHEPEAAAPHRRTIDRIVADYRA
jgi:aminoglycoside phosphotransferase (APT) family kinase protein